MPLENADQLPVPDSLRTTVEISHSAVSMEALLKACYWFSRDFSCDIRKISADRSEVILSPKAPISEAALAAANSSFLQSAMDFALREKVDARTSGIRDLLLAKAFSESGVLEEQPAGVFGDSVEESKPDGMFRILSNS